MTNRTAIVNLSDLVDPDDPNGRTYRQVNAAKTHGIPLGALVELGNGARLFVVYLGRDCDQTPLYWLAMSPDEDRRDKWRGGYDEDALTEVPR